MSLIFVDIHKQKSPERNVEGHYVNVMLEFVGPDRFWNYWNEGCKSIFAHTVYVG